MTLALLHSTPPAKRSAYLDDFCSEVPGLSCGRANNRIPRFRAAREAKRMNSSNPFLVETP